MSQQPEIDLDVRIAGFNVELKKLLGKYQLGLVGEAFLQDGIIKARAAVVEDSKPKIEAPVVEINDDGKPEAKADEPKA